MQSSDRLRDASQCTMLQGVASGPLLPIVSMPGSRKLSETPPLSSADWVVLAIALTLPTAVTWLYFVALADQPAWLQKGAYTIGKGVQFALPTVWVLLVRRERIVWKWPGLSGIAVGLGFGLAVLAAMVALYFVWLKPAGLFAGPTVEVRAKVESFGVQSLGSYLALAVFYSLIHSLLEEYYWRWFVFRQLSRGLSLPAAIATSSVGFAAHHVLVLGTYFGYGAPLTWLFTTGIVIGGAAWAALYFRSRSLAGPWISHALVDATIFVIGWDLIRPA